MKAMDLPRCYNAAQILEHNLVAHSDKTALYSLERTMTFQQVSNEANQVGNALRRLGVGLGNFFQDVTDSGGFGHLQKGHAVSFADLDNDGDKDIYAVIGGAYTGDVFQNVLFENPGHDNHWITLQLEGVQSNRSAIGARIRVRVMTSSGNRDIYATVTTGGSFGSSSLQQEIGLGQATAIETLEITWPATGQVQILNDVEMDRIVKIREGESEIIPVDLKQFDLSGTNQSDSITVRFTAASSPDIPWGFYPLDLEIQVQPGQTVRTNYYVYNTSDQTITGKAVHEVLPFEDQTYLKTIQCFCFTEQTLAPDEAKIMPLVFRIDFDVPQDVTQYVIGYTFYTLESFPEIGESQ